MEEGRELNSVPKNLSQKVKQLICAPVIERRKYWKGETERLTEEKAALEKINEDRKNARVNKFNNRIKLLEKCKQPAWETVCYSRACQHVINGEKDAFLSNNHQMTQLCTLCC